MGNSLLLEKIDEQSQAIARLTAENRTTREWFKSRLELLWETSKKRDETIAAAMESIFEYSYEMSRHLALREAGEKLEVLLTGTIPTQPIPTTVDATTSPAVPKSPTPPLMMTSLPEFPDDLPSNKRPGDDDLTENKKRRKIGDGES